MATLVRNKLVIIPNASSPKEYYNQIKEVFDYCSAMEDGIRKNMCFTKIAPKETNFELGTKEEDDWLLKNWGTRFKALNACWISDNEIIFDTFWNPSIPIIIKIIKNFKNTDFNFKFASKRTGRKAGEINASKGKIISFKKYKNFSKEAYETAFELMPHMSNFYVFNIERNSYEYDTSDFRAQIEQNGFYKEDDGTVLVGCDDKKKPLFNSINDLPF